MAFSVGVFWTVGVAIGIDPPPAAKTALEANIKIVINALLIRRTPLDSTNLDLTKRLDLSLLPKEYICGS